jgi:predicted DNA binding CopG/RHH family protein
MRDDSVKVTLTLSRSSVEFFKREAKRNRVPYQRMIRALVDEYTQRHT